MSLISTILQEETLNTAASAAAAGTARGLTDAPFVESPLPEEEGTEFYDTKDVLLAPVRGLEGFAQGIYNLGDALTLDALPDWDKRFFGKSESTVGGLVEGATQFLTAFIPIGGVLGKAGQGLGMIQKGAKGFEFAGKLASAGAGVQRAAKVGKQVLQGAITDFVAFDGQDQRLSNLMESVPALRNPVTEYLKADPNDGEIEGRFKNTIEGLFLEGGQQALAPLFTRGVKTMRDFKNKVNSGIDPSVAAREANDELLAENGGELKTLYTPQLFERQIETPKGAGMIIEGPEFKEPAVPLVAEKPLINPETGLPMEITKGGKFAIETTFANLLRNTKSTKELEQQIAQITELNDVNKIVFGDPEFTLEKVKSNYAANGLDPNDAVILFEGTNPEIFNRVLFQQAVLNKEVQRSGAEWLSLSSQKVGKTGDELLQLEAKIADAGIQYERSLALYTGYGTGGSQTLLNRQRRNLGFGKEAADKAIEKPLDNFDPELDKTVKEIETASPEDLINPVVKEGEKPTVKTPEEIQSDYDNRIAKLEGDLAVQRKIAFEEPTGKDYKVTVDEEGKDLPVKQPKPKSLKEIDLEERIASYKKMQQEHVKLQSALKEFEDLRKMGPERFAEIQKTKAGRKDLNIQLPEGRADALRKKINVLKQNLVDMGKKQLNDSKALQREQFGKYAMERLGSKTQADLDRTLALCNNIDDVEKRAAMTAYAQNTTMGRKMFDVTHEFFINSLFSPATAVVNALGGITTILLKNTEMMVGNALIGNFGMVKAQFSALTTVQGFHEIMEASVLAMKTSDSVLSSSEAAGGQMVRSSDQFDGRVYGGAISANTFGLNPDDKLGTAVDWMGRATRLYSTLLVGGDEVMKQVAYRQFIRTELYMEALQKGIKDGKALTDYTEKKLKEYVLQGGKMYNEKNLFETYSLNARKAGITPEMGDRYNEFMKNQYTANPFSKTKSALAMAAQEHALKLTFANEAGDAFTQGLMKGLDAVPVLKFILPFVKTPTNILKFGLDRSPLGLAKDAVLLLTSSKYRDMHINGTPAMRAELVGRMTVASTFTFAAMTYIANNEGAITGGGPQNKEEKDALKLTGWQPYSIKIGDKYVSYNRLDPIATPLGILADIGEFNRITAPKDDSTASNAMSALLVSMTYNLTDKSYLRGLNNLLNALRDPETYGPKIFQDIFAGFVPNTLNQLQNTESQIILRESRSVADAMQRRIPGLSEALPPQRTFLGDVVYKDNPLGLLSMASPVYFSSPKNDIVDQEIGSLIHGFTMPPPKLHGIDDLDMRNFSNNEGVQAYDRYLELSGTTLINNKNLRQTLASMLKSPEYKQFPKDNVQDQIGTSSPRIAAINRVVKRFRNKAQYEMLGEFPELYQKSKELTQKQRDYRLGKFENQQ